MKGTGEMQDQGPGPVKADENAYTGLSPDRLESVLKSIRQTCDVLEDVAECIKAERAVDSLGSITTLCMVRDLLNDLISEGNRAINKRIAAKKRERRDAQQEWGQPQGSVGDPNEGYGDFQAAALCQHLIDSHGFDGNVAMGYNYTEAKVEHRNLHEDETAANLTHAHQRGVLVEL